VAVCFRGENEEGTIAFEQLEKMSSDKIMKRVIFLFSDTGGGHRSATEAIIEALEFDYPGHFEIGMVDVFKEYAPRPLDKAPDLYPEMTKLPLAWEVGYKLTDGQRRVRMLETTFRPYIKRAVTQLQEDYPAEIYVSVHPVFNEGFIRELGPDRPLFMTVVTDMITAHSFWYAPDADLCVVATDQARQRAIDNGVDPSKVEVIGLPVSQAHAREPGDRSEYCRQLGWPEDLPVVLLIGGGEGMGPLRRTAIAISSLDVQFGLAIITGRNRELREELQSRAWTRPVFVYGFERRLPQMMRGASLLVTKAGPGTISEALNAHLPIVLYSRLPGQEEGNVDFVVESGTGFWAPGPERSALTVRRILLNQSMLKDMRLRCAEHARPEAARRIAKRIASQLELSNS
jgi:1,2-diacylglycerol 3-beta-galactosyltransferase